MCFNALHMNKVIQLSEFLPDHTYLSVKNIEQTPTESLLMLSDEKYRT